MGNNILRPLNIKLNYGNRTLETGDAIIRIFFKKLEEEYVMLSGSLGHQAVFNIDFNGRDPVLREIRLEHMNEEEKSEVKGLVRVFSDMFFQEGTDLTFTHAIPAKQRRR